MKIKMYVGNVIRTDYRLNIGFGDTMRILVKKEIIKKGVIRCHFYYRGRIETSMYSSGENDIIDWLV